MQKSYSDKRRWPLVFKVGDFVYLQVSHTKGVQRFGVKGKLAPRYIGPYEILEQKGPVAYKLTLPDQLASIHDVFHVSQLKKCLRVPEEILEDPELELESDLTYEERPIKILDQKTWDTQTKSIKFYKVQRKDHTKDEATWEQAEYLKSKYPELFEDVWDQVSKCIICTKAIKQFLLWSHMMKGLWHIFLSVVTKKSSTEISEQDSFKGERL